MPCPLPNDAGRGYYEYLPPGYGTGARFPLVVFLHGSGESGDGSPAQLPAVLRHGPPRLIERGTAFPAIVISPQTANDWSISITTPFVDHVLRRYDVDPDRVYITGLSLGGYGTWEYARHRRDLVAAIAPICGPERGTGYGVLDGLPIWAFHRMHEEIVPVEDSENVLGQVTGVRPRSVEGQTGYFDGALWSWRAGEAAPGATENPAFTVYPGGDHDAWTAAYDNGALWDWLFSHRRTTRRRIGR